MKSTCLEDRLLAASLAAMPALLLFQPAFWAFVETFPCSRSSSRRILQLTQTCPQGTLGGLPHANEHALEVELPFLQTVLGSARIVPLLVGSATPTEVAEVLSRLWDDDTLIVVSSDLSHFLRYEDAQRRDSATADAIERLDETAIDFEDACGAIPVRGLLIEAKRRGLSIERLDLRNSGDTAGDRDRVVGYGAWAIRAG